MRKIAVVFLSVAVALEAGALSVDTGEVTSEAKPAPSTPVRDNARGFELLFKLGLPDVGKAAYARLDMRGGTEGMEMAYYLQQLRLQGNAWLLGTNADGSANFIVDQSRRVTVRDFKSANAEMMAKQKEIGERMMKAGGKPDEALQFELQTLMEENNRKPSGTWRDADLGKDVTNLIAKLSKRDETSQRGMDQVEMMIQQAGGNCFLFAAHLYRRGMTKEANTIVNLLNERAREPRQLMIQTVSIIAQGQYAELYRSFLENRSWDAFGAGLTNLMARFPATWLGYGGIKRLSEKVQARLAAPKPPPLQGVGLTAEDQALAAEIAGMSNDEIQSFRSMYYGLWLLPDSNRTAGVWAKKTNSPLMRIVTRGIQAIPILAAMIKDDYLLPVDSRTIGRYGGGMMHYAMMMDQINPEMQERMQEQMWEQMQRPISRGDIARTMLDAVIPVDRQMRGGRKSPEEVAEDAMAFYATCSNMTPLGIARHYLASGDQSKEQQGIQYLVQHATNDTDFAFIEQQLLKGDPQQTQYQVQMYASQRREKARDFVAKYIELFSAAKSPYGYEGMPAAERTKYQKREATQRAAQTNRLWQMVNPGTSSNAAATIEKYLEKIAGGNRQAMQYMYYDHQAFEKEGVVAMVTKILQAAVKATNVTGRSTLIDMASSQAMRNMRQAMDPRRAAATDQQEQLKLEQHALLWRKLAEDDRAIPDTDMQMWYSAGMTPEKINDKVYVAVETLYQSQDSNAVPGRPLNYYMGMAMGYGETDVPDWTDMAARGKARLAGAREEALPPLPSAARVNDARRAQIAAELAKAAKPAAAIAKLNRDELQALRQMCAKDEKLNAAMVPHANRIAAIKANMADAASAARVKALQGTVMSTNTVAVLRDLVEATVRTGRCVMVYAMRGPRLDGYNLRVEEPDPAKPGASQMFMNFGGYGRGAMSMIQAMVNANELNGNAMWPVKGIKESAPAKTDDDALEEDAEAMSMWEQNDDNFWDALATALGAEHGVGVQTMIMITGINGPAMKKMAEKLGTQGEDEDGETVVEEIVPGML